MEREKHYMQDAAEIYAVYLMQSEVERLGKAIRCTSPDLWTTFTNYLEERGLSTNDFKLTELGSYKANTDRHIPNFVARLCEMNADQLFEFQLVESEFRNLGLKGDFIIIGSTWDEPVAVSLKNYAGKSGILRPQVASGTFASFAAGFVFEKAGVGKYIDPRDPAKTFQGSNVKTRNEILSWMGADEIASRLAVLDQLQSMVREEFLGEDCRYYDKLRVQVAARKIASIGIDAVIAVFDLLGLDKVRSRFVERIGMDGKEEVLFFDSERCVDSITNRRYHDFRLMLNSAETSFAAIAERQSIRFQFAGEQPIFEVSVPFTINTNGAWWRPTERYEGTQTVIDKNHPVELQWGERRPYKSKEIATSVNTYVNLGATGIFD